MIGTTEDLLFARTTPEDMPEEVYRIVAPPPPKWKVTIPRGGDFVYQTSSDLAIWQRFWMRFIGWGVEPYEK